MGRLSRMLASNSLIFGMFWLAACTTTDGSKASKEDVVASAKAATDPASANEGRPQDMQNLPDIAGSESKDGAVFNVRGAVARQVYRQLSGVGQRSHEGEMEVVTYSGPLEISCVRTGGVLPPGTRGYPAPVNYECMIKGSAAKSGPGSSDVVVLKNGAAKRFFGALAATPTQKDEKVSKSYKGNLVITCKGGTAALDGAKCEALKVAH